MRAHLSWNRRPLTVKSRGFDRTAPRTIFSSPTTPRNEEGVNTIVHLRLGQLSYRRDISNATLLGNDTLRDCQLFGTVTLDGIFPTPLFSENDTLRDCHLFGTVTLDGIFQRHPIRR